MKNPLDKFKRKPVQEESVSSQEGNLRTHSKQRHTQEDLGRMTEDQIIALPVEVLEALSSDKLSKLPTNALERLPKEALDRVDPGALVRLGKKDHSRLLKLKRDKFFEVLKEDPSMLSLYTTDHLVGMFGSDVLVSLIQLPHEDLISRLPQALLTHLMKQPGSEYRRLNALFNKYKADPPTRVPYENKSSFHPPVDTGPALTSPYWDPISPSESMTAPTSKGEDGGSRGSSAPSRHHPPPSYGNRAPPIPRRSSRSGARSNGNTTPYHDEPRNPTRHASFEERARTGMGSSGDRERDFGSKVHFESEYDYSASRGLAVSARFPGKLSDERREILRLKEVIEQLEKQIDELQSGNDERNRQREGERQSLIDQIAELKTDIRVTQRTTEKQVTDFFRRKGVEVSMKANDDPIDFLISKTDEFYNQAAYNYEIAMNTRTQASDAATEKHTLEQQLGRARDEIKVLREAEDRLRSRANEANYLAEQNKLVNRKLSELVAKYNGDVDRETAELRGENMKLQQELTDLRNTFGKKFDEKRKWYDEEARIAREEADKVKVQYQAKLKDKDDEWAARLQSEKEDHESELASEKAKFEQWIREREELHGRNVVDLQNTVKSLKGSLVDNSDDFRPATDDALKEKYLGLKLAIHTVTFNSGSSGVKRSGSGFSGRQGNMGHFQLQSTVWAKVIEGFFSEPFGFGALGPGDGRRKLVGVYQAWRGIFDAAPSTDVGHHPVDEFDIFRTNLDANKWRSATFQSIYSVVFPKGQKKGQPASGLMVRLFSSNMRTVRKEIVDILDENSAGGVQEELLGEDISRIVQLAGELALEFGCQRALLGVDAPESGETVRIGQGFVDCENGDTARGQTEEVDLVVSPKLYRIGDGRYDLKMMKVICPGEIYPKV